MPDNRLVTLRSATPNDADHIARLHTLSWQNAYSHILPAAYLSNDVPMEHATRWRNYFDRNEAERGLVLIAVSDGMSIGFVSAERPVDPTRGVLLDCLHVHPAHHGKGTGKRMIESVRAWARTIGADRVHLSVLKGNVRAIGFYEHNGWRLAAVETSFIGRTEVIDRIYVIEAWRPVGIDSNGRAVHDPLRTESSAASAILRNTAAANPPPFRAPRPAGSSPRHTPDSARGADRFGTTRRRLSTAPECRTASVSSSRER